MATRTWLDSNGDWEDTDNWSGATAPVTGDTVIIASGSQNITTNLDQSAVDELTIIIGEDFQGTIGTSGTNLEVGDDITLRFNGKRCQGCFITITSGDVYVTGASHYPNSLVLNGTVTSIYVSAANNLTLGSALTATNLYLEGPQITATLESGLTLTNAFVNAGVITCQAALTNLYMSGGLWKHMGTSTNDITLVELRAAQARFIWDAPGSTIGYATVYAGIFDGSVDPGAKTLTDGEVHFGGTLNLSNGLDTITATYPVAVYAGTLILDASQSSTVELAPMAPGNPMAPAV